MPIQKWHPGKIGLLWAWGAGLCFVIIQVVIRTANFVPGFFLLALLLLILIVLSVITWKWLGGREQ